MPAALSNLGEEHLKKILLCTMVVHTASVAPKSSSTLLQGDGRCRTAGRTSGNPTHIPGITGYAKSRVFGRAAHAKFIKICLSKYNASLCLHVAWKYWMFRLAGNALQSQGCTNLDSRDYQRIVWRSMHLWSYHNKKIGCLTSKASRAVLAVARSFDNLFTGDEAGRYLKQS